MNRKGFTTIELLVTITIISIMILILLPVLIRDKEERLQQLEVVVVEEKRLEVVERIYADGCYFYLIKDKKTNQEFISTSKGGITPLINSSD